MSNQWLRLWHDMPNDPKWRTVARIAGQSIGLVQAVYLHLLVEASRNVTRGHACVTAEDLASALDVTEAEIQSIFDAMQTRVLDGMYLLGWEKRQPKREDTGDENSGAKSAAQRKAEQRAREKLAEKQDGENAAVTQSHAESREVTLDKIREDKRRKDIADRRAPAFNPLPQLAALGVSAQTAADWLALRKAKRAIVTVTALNQIIAEADKASLPMERALSIACKRGWAGFEAKWLKDEDLVGATPVKDWE